MEADLGRRERLGKAAETLVPPYASHALVPHRGPRYARQVPWSLVVANAICTRYYVIYVSTNGTA
eukprot:34045-Rhodomonas_salina.2